MESVMFSDNVKIIHQGFYFCCIIREGRPIAKVYGTTPEKCKNQAELFIRLLNDEEERTKSKVQPENDQRNGQIQG